MEYQKILNLLNESNDSKFVTRKWNIVSDQSNAKYDVRNEINFNTEVLKSNLCDYKDASILVRGNITIIGNQVTQVPFKTYAPFSHVNVQSNIVQIIVYDFIQKMKQLILMQILLMIINLNLSNIRLNY